MKKIDTIEQWNILAEALRKQRWHIWQWQHDWNDPGGFHAWFRNDGKSDVEVMTRNEDVKKVIIKYGYIFQNCSY